MGAQGGWPGERRACGEVACAPQGPEGLVLWWQDGCLGLRQGLAEGKREILPQLRLGLEGRRLRGSMECLTCRCAVRRSTTSALQKLKVTLDSGLL